MDINYNFNNDQLIYYLKPKNNLPGNQLSTGIFVSDIKECLI